MVLCSGKHYYTLAEAIGKNDIKDIAVVRVEELSPFPYEELEDVISAYGPTIPVVWAQEEPGNQGAWTYVRPRIDSVLSSMGAMPVQYAGRKAAATTAVGVGAWHKAEAAEIVRAALE